MIVRAEGGSEKCEVLGGGGLLAKGDSGRENYSLIQNGWNERRERGEKGDKRVCMRER